MKLNVGYNICKVKANESRDGKKKQKQKAGKDMTPAGSPNQLTSKAFWAREMEPATHPIRRRDD